MLTEISTAYYFLRTCAEYLENDVLLGDAERMKRQAQWLTALEGKRTKALVTYLTSFKELRDAVVTVINGHGKFQVPDTVYKVFRRSKKSSVLPLFLRSLLRQFIEEDGSLSEQPDLLAIEITLTLLTLVKRVRSSAVDKSAEAVAIEKFKNLQTTNRAKEPVFASNLKLILERLTSEMNPTLAFPGPGAVSGRYKNYTPQLTMVNPAYSKSCPNAIKFMEACYQSYFGFDTIDETNSLLLKIQRSSEAKLNFYPLDVPRMCKLVTVDKDVTSKRPITVTNSPAKVQVNASLRLTIFESLRTLGLLNVANVHDQSISQAQLNKPYMAFLDLKDGSGCLTYSLLDDIWPKWVTDVWKETRDVECTLPSGEIIAVTTGLMGDAAMAAILTTTLVACQIQAVILENRLKRRITAKDRLPLQDPLVQHYLDRLECDPYATLSVDPFTPEEINEAITKVRVSGDHSQVGDDVSIDAQYERALRRVFKAIGVTVNEHKSSGPGSIYRETCGGHSLVNPQTGVITRTYFGRAPSSLNHHDVLLTASEFLQKIANRPTVYPMTVAFGLQFSPDFITCSSFYATHIGSPIVESAKVPKTVSSRTRSCELLLGDDLSYAFHGLSPDLQSNSLEFGDRTIGTFEQRKLTKSLSHLKNSEYYRYADLKKVTTSTLNLLDDDGFSQSDRLILTDSRLKAEAKKLVNSAIKSVTIKQSYRSHEHFGYSAIGF